MAYGKKLTAEEIAIRMVELRNLRVAHKHDRKQIKELRAEVKQLKNEKAEDRAYFEAIIDNQNARIAELEAMVFGRKKRPRISDDSNKFGKHPRDKDSFKR